MTELVSILIPAYNAEKKISDTIKSALNQAWPNKEIIIVDDGSTDNTLHIASQFESKSVRVLTQKNMGVCAARNKALAFAGGDYIQWLDADDILGPDKISHQIKKSDRDRNSRILLTSSWGTFYFRHHRAKFIHSSLWNDLSPVEWLTIKFTENAWMNPATWLVSRRLIELAGPWNEKLLRDNDGEYICRVVSVSEKVIFAPESKSYYRIGNLGSISRNITDQKLDSIFLSTVLCINYLLSLEDSNKTRDACVKFLQHRFSYFYPEKQEIIDKANELARALGGNELRPQQSWNFFLFRKIFGWKMAKITKNKLWKTGVLIRKEFDRFLYYLNAYLLI